MDRKRFLGRVGLFIGGLAVGRHVELPPAVDPVPPPAVSAAKAARSMQLVASGGLCAPFTPYYDMPAFAARPIREALPAFTAERGGISGS